jgi:Lrp/AsnC family leucine-responsive transcriptional regulator
MFKTLNNKALDDLNWSILKELCRNARIATAEIGRRVGLSAPAVGERIQKLEELGYIKEYRAVLDFDKIGLTIQAFINYKVSGLRHVELMKLVTSLPEVIEWYTITGNASIILKVATRSRQELADVIVKLEEHGETSTSLILEGSIETDVLK